MVSSTVIWTNVALSTICVVLDGPMLNRALEVRAEGPTMASRTFLEPLADGDTIKFWIGMYGNTGSYRANGQAFIHKVG